MTKPDDDVRTLRELAPRLLASGDRTGFAMLSARLRGTAAPSPSGAAPTAPRPAPPGVSPTTAPHVVPPPAALPAMTLRQIGQPEPVLVEAAARAVAAELAARGTTLEGAAATVRKMLPHVTSAGAVARIYRLCGFEVVAASPDPTVKRTLDEARAVRGIDVDGVLVALAQMGVRQPDAAFARQWHRIRPYVAPG